MSLYQIIPNRVVGKLSDAAGIIVTTPSFARCETGTPITVPSTRVTISTGPTGVMPVEIAVRGVSINIGNVIINYGIANINFAVLAIIYSTAK